jgi:hypothetical protein
MQIWRESKRAKYQSEVDQEVDCHMKVRSSSLLLLHTMGPIPNGDEEDSNPFRSGTVPKYATITVAHLVKVA